MKTEELIRLRQYIFKQVEEVMDNKGKEYSGKEDRLANFKRNGKNLGLAPEAIWGVYCGKHWDSLMSFLKDLNSGIDIKALEGVLSEPIDGRIMDIITYLILLQGLIEERRTK